MRTQLWSSGGGVQSAAIAALIVTGRLPKPDYACIVDTGREKQTTWNYLDNVIRPACAAIGLEITRISKADFATVDLYRNDDLLIPAFTTLSGQTSKLDTYCSNEWKRRVVMRWARQIGLEQVDNWIGFSTDEIKRVRAPQAKWWREVYPLIFTVRMRRQECVSLVESLGWPTPPRSSCWMCLSGETEIVTRDGIKPIGSLVNTTHQVLVPKTGKVGGLSEIGSFKSAPIRSFGKQKLWAITLRKGRSQKVIFATADHRWLLAPRRFQMPLDYYWRTTKTLKPDDVLRNLRATPIGREYPLPLSIMQGFVFGDGTKGEGDRPASLSIFEGKDEVMRPLFDICNPRERINSDGNRIWFVYGLPRSWKTLPDIRESRAFLFGWLSGWFAADGTVSKDAFATLYAAKSEYLEFARSVSEIIGIRTSVVSSRNRIGIRGAISNLSSIRFMMHDMPRSFFLLEHHKQRIESYEKQDRLNHWIVCSVEPTDRVEEVYCATVEGIGAFGLAGGLMTGNCPNMSDQEWLEIKENRPDEFHKAVAFEKSIRARDRFVYLHKSARPIGEVDFSEDESQPSLFGCNSGQCFV